MIHPFIKGWSELALAGHSCEQDNCVYKHGGKKMKILCYDYVVRMVHMSLMLKQNWIFEILTSYYICLFSNNEGIAVCPGYPLVIGR